MLYIEYQIILIPDQIIEHLKYISIKDHNGCISQYEYNLNTGRHSDVKGCFKWIF